MDGLLLSELLLFHISGCQVQCQIILLLPSIKNKAVQHQIFNIEETLQGKQQQQKTKNNSLALNSQYYYRHYLCLWRRPQINEYENILHYFQMCLEVVFR